MLEPASAPSPESIATIPCETAKRTYIVSMKSRLRIRVKSPGSLLAHLSLVGLTAICMLMLPGVVDHSRAGEKKALETATFALG